MELEKELRQRTFRSEYTKAFLNILFTASWLNARQMKLFRPYGLSGPQFNVLRILRGKHPEPVSINLILGRMVEKTSNVSRIVDKLLAKELIERRVCPRDRRSVDVMITPKGLDMLHELDAHEIDFERATFSLTDTEVRQLNHLLDKLRA